MTKGSVKPNTLLNIVLSARGKNAIDGETRQIINKFMDEMGVPCTDYENGFRQIVNQAVIFMFEVNKLAFEHWLCDAMEKA